MKEKLRINFEELEKEKEKRIKEREWFIDYWVEYIKTHSDEEWSSQQNVIVNSQFPISDKNK